MTDQEILTSAITEAIGNGWSAGFVDPNGGFRYTTEGLEWGSTVLACCENHLIFDHEFAKALWGGINMLRYGQDKYPYAKDQLLPAWQYHLQRMVVADDPIKYLGENI